YAVAEVSLVHRRSGGLYRWEARMLHEDDRSRVVDTLRVVTERIAVPVRSMHPELSSTDVRIRTTAALSILGSITSHRTPLARRRIPPLLVGGCLAVIACPPPSAHHEDAGSTTDGPAEPQRGAGRRVSPQRPDAHRPAADRQEALLAEALRLFARRGYHEA